MEIKVRPSDSESITLTGRDVKILLLGRNDTVTALAERIHCSRGGLSSFLSGKVELHKTRKALAAELERTIADTTNTQPDLAKALISLSAGSLQS
jgi:hypothetical protein